MPFRQGRQTRLPANLSYRRAAAGAWPAVEPLAQRSKLHGHHHDREAGNEGSDRGECGNVTKKVSHRRLLCSLCLYFVLFLYAGQQENK
jgi:hypothetical protein